MNASKRFVDLTCCALAVPVFGPAMLTIAACILLDDGGPVFFRQRRVGIHGKIFEIWKFRSMKDEKVTRAGRWLRQTGLDELPQFFNVLRGEMSIVGPRPLTRSDIDRLGWASERSLARWSVKPGVTGPAQIHGGHGAVVSLQQDLRYVRTRSTFGDLFIIAISFAMNLIGKKRVRRHLSPPQT